MEEERRLCYTTCTIFLWNTLRSTRPYVLYLVKLNGYAQGWTTYFQSSLTFNDFFFHSEKPVSKLLSYNFILWIKAHKFRFHIYFVVSVLQMLMVLLFYWRFVQHITIVWPYIVTDSLWIKPTDALNSNFIGITTLHVSGSLSAHHQEFLVVHRLWYILCGWDEPFATRSRMELLAVPSYSW